MLKEKESILSFAIWSQFVARSSMISYLSVVVAYSYKEMIK